ncbi:hypothetical protein BKA63DRAFT_583990 [Paraphoma chrysanthemicola]|nr:hypothetical protein BKA63DRAFT_583990 [Paraphoma chrysanthemicola]
MPYFEDIEYSHAETIAAIRDYYQFLTTMYLDETYIVEPPPDGWPDISTRSYTLDKSKKVINLLQHLPYIKFANNDTLDAEAGPDCIFADWQSIFKRAADRKTVTSATEGPSISDKVPRNVIGLTWGNNHTPKFLLDVKLGTIQWYACPGEACDEPINEPIQDDPYDYFSGEEEAEWRAEGETWTILDFFEELKEHFRRLNLVPLSRKKVVHVWKTAPENYQEMLVGVKHIYRQHAWPDLKQYDKEECLKAVEKFVEENYPQ